MYSESRRSKRAIAADVSSKGLVVFLMFLIQEVLGHQQDNYKGVTLMPIGNRQEVYLVQVGRHLGSRQDKYLCT